MEFIDKTGHIFSIDSYDAEPIGYEYDEHPYVFWLDAEYSFNLSVNNYYIKGIYAVVQGEVSAVKITLNSKIFSLIAPSAIQSGLQGGLQGDIYHDLSINSDIMQQSIIYDDDDKKYIASVDGFSIIPVYICGLSAEEGTFETNVLINIDDDYCPITVGGTFVDEFEELVINANNMGIYLPKDILRAVYQCGFYNEVPNEAIFNDKIKELLLNYMNIRGERGNFRSAIDSLKWFGWGNKIEISRLLKTDNEFMDQYILDYFNLNTDIIYAYRHFRQTMYIKLSMRGNAETGKYNKQEFDADFWGEGKPKMEDLFDKVIEVPMDDDDELKFSRSFYDYTMNEMMLKLSALKYYYEKYFLPIHLKCHSVAIEYQTYMNDIKLFGSGYETMNERPCMIMDDNIEVTIGDDDPDDGYVFDGKKIFYIYTDNIIVDDDSVHFTGYDEAKDGKIMMHEMCVKVPLDFKDRDGNLYTNPISCSIILAQENKSICQTTFSFIQTETDRFQYFVICPKFMTNADNGIENGMTEWLDKNYALYVRANDTWFDFSFMICLPEINIEMGRLEYKYKKEFRQYDEDKLIAAMHDTRLVTVNNDDFMKDIMNEDNISNMSQYVLAHYIQRNNIRIDKPQFLNRCHLLSLENVNTADIDNNMTIMTIDGDAYDFYRMHDKDNTEYGILISRKPQSDLSDLKCPALSSIPGATCIASDSKCLINRMKYMPANGKNIFNKDDVIVCTLNSESQLNRLTFSFKQGTKWTFSHMLPSQATTHEVHSNTEMAIVSMPKGHNEFLPGYYNVTVNYKIGCSNNTYTKFAKFRINK